MVRNLSYVGYRSPAAEEWRTFGPEVLGAELAADGADGEVRLRIDEAPWRIAVHPGDQDDLAYLGWDVGTPADLEAVVERLADQGLTVSRAESRRWRTCPTRSASCSEIRRR